MRTDSLTFVTPYWSGREMMQLHLASIRRFHPDAPILVSKKGGEAEEMEGYRAAYGVQYWLEDCNYVDALLRLLQRCETEYVCITDHDVVLLSSLEPLLQGLIDQAWNLVGIEERVRVSPATDWQRLAPQYNGWLRFAPGYMDATLLMFNLREFVARWGLKGVRGTHPQQSWESEYHYGICEKLIRHKYLLPYHTRTYGLGNLVKDGDVAVLWHQWYGSYRKRLVAGTAEAEAPDVHETYAEAHRGEQAFLEDYPDLDLADLTPAWGPGWDLEAERAAARRGYPSRWRLTLVRLRSWRQAGLRGFSTRLAARVERWRRLHFQRTSE